MTVGVNLIPFLEPVLPHILEASNAFPGSHHPNSNFYQAVMHRPVAALDADNDNPTEQTSRRPFNTAAPETPLSENDPRNPSHRFNPMLWVVMNQLNDRFNQTGIDPEVATPASFRQNLNEVLSVMETTGAITPEFRNSINQIVGSTSGLSQFQQDFNSFREGGVFNGPQRGTSVSESEMERIARRSPADREGDFRVIAVQTGVGRGGRAMGTMAIVDHEGNVVRDPQTGQPAIYDFVSGIRSHGRGGAMPGFNGGNFFGSENDGINAVWRLNSPVYNHNNPRIDGFFMHVTGYESRTGRSEIGIHRSVSVGNGDVYDRGGSMGCPVMNAQDTASFARIVRSAGNLRPDMIVVADRNLGGPTLQA